MKLLTIAALCFASIPAVGQFTHKAHKLQYNEQGNVYFERVENVYNRDAKDIMEYARAFAKQQGAKVILDDTAGNTLKLEFRWKMTDVSKGNMNIKSI